MSIDSISLISGPTPIIIVGLGLGATALSLRWKDGVWKTQLLYGLPITLALVGLIALLVDGLALIPYQFPNSYYLWVGLVVLALVVGIIGWRRFRNWRRVVSVLSVLLSAAMAMTLINKQYQYYPTVGSLLGVNAQNQVSPQQLQAIRDRARGEHGGAIPTHGFTIQIPIPGKESGFAARDAFVWVPPVWVADEKVKLPVIELLIGTPGDPSDWTRAAMADVTAREFADAHHGQAPIIVMPDENGSFSGDTECVNSSRGNVETYLTVDVPDFMHSHFNAKTGNGSVALAGLSEGGMCAMMLTLRHPDKYPAFADYSGLTSPTLSEAVDPPATIRQLFGGSQAAYNAHDPLFLLRQQKFPNTAGWYEVGTADSVPLAAQRTLVPLARSAGILTCAVEIPGEGHDFTLWERAFRESLPFLSWQLGLTEKPPSIARNCSR
jgi:pimeloyl-ACP methyl ester carboxylesterase